MEKLKESMENVPVYGKNIKELWGKLDLNSSSLKTAQCSLFEDLNKSFAILPKAGMIVNGRCLSATQFGFNHKRERIYGIAYAIEIGRKNHLEIFRPIQEILHERTPRQSPISIPIERFNGKSSYDNVRMDDGFSRELDKRRIEDMGNAVIPLIAYYLFECIKKFRESI